MAIIIEQIKSISITAENFIGHIWSTHSGSGAGKQGGRRDHSFWNCRSHISCLSSYKVGKRMWVYILVREVHLEYSQENIQTAA